MITLPSPNTSYSPVNGTISICAKAENWVAASVSPSALSGNMKSCSGWGTSQVAPETWSIWPTWSKWLWEMET